MKTSILFLKTQTHKIFPSTTLLFARQFLLLCLTICASQVSATIRYVNENATGSGKGTNWENASNNLQAMIDASGNGDEIWVAKGTYKPTVIANSGPAPINRDKTFLLKTGVKIYGGFAGTENSLAERNLRLSNASILSGDLGNNDTSDPATYGENAMHVVLVVNTGGFLDGFTVTGGNTDDGHMEDNTYRDVIVNGEHVYDHRGAGIMVNTPGAASTFNNLKIIGNSAGGGISVTRYTAYSSLLTSISNTVISGNTGGGIAVSALALVLTNVTISGNLMTPSYDYGSGVEAITASCKFRNTIVYNNGSGSPDNADQLSFLYSPAPEISNSLLAGLTTNSGSNISGSTDPLFVNPATPGLSKSGDYRLTSTSTLINMGGNSFFNSGQTPDLFAFTTDLAGINRKYDGTAEIGAYEFSAAPNASGIVFVKQNGTGDGSSWDNALSDIQLAINTPGAQQVWVAKGTYKPNRRADATVTITNGDRNNAFVIKNGVQVYGGFAETEATLSARNLSLTANTTILSGDLGGNDAGGTITDNAYHVVVLAQVGGILDGFSVTGGNANGTGYLNVSGNSGDQSAYQGNGGGILLNNTTQGSFNNLNISGNRAVNGGGLASYTGAASALSNTLISGNLATGKGGGMYLETRAPVFTNVTISGNKSPNGGGIRTEYLETLFLRNSVISGNDGGGVSLGEESDISYQYCLIQGITASSGNNISGSVDPMFVAPQPASAAPTTTGVYRLKSGSPLLNKGNNQYFASGQTPDLSAIATDLAGTNRKSEGSADIGAYEFIPTSNASGIMFVKQNGAGDGSSWDSALGDLQLALNTAGAQQVWVAKGTFKPNRRADATTTITSGDRDNAFVLKNGIQLYGGFAGTETTLNERNLSLTENATILSGDLGGNDAGGTVTDNAYHVVILAQTGGILDGFSITGGNATGSGSINVSGVLNDVSAHRGTGGGILLNRTTQSSLNNLIISGNRAHNGGGLASGSGVASALTNTVISGNLATNQGGGMYLESRGPVLTNVTISGNSSPNGGGIRTEYLETLFLRNTVIYGNDGGGVSIGEESGINYQNSLIQGTSSTAATNIGGDVDPLFINQRPGSAAPTSAGDYKLLSCSPLVNKGNNSLMTLSSDLAGNPRIRNSTVEIGAYELTIDPTVLPQGSLTAGSSRCTDQLGQLIFTSTAGTGPFNLIINNQAYNNITSGIAFNTISPLSVASAFTLSSIISVSGGCARTTDITGSSATVTVNTIPQGSLNVIDVACEGTASQLKFTSTSGTGPFSLVVDGITYTDVVSGVPFAGPSLTGSPALHLTQVLSATGCERTSGFTTANAVPVGPNSPTASPNGIIFVKLGSLGNGSSWDCAFGNLQAAIDGAASGHQVWVAKGTYQRSHAQSFIMKEGVKIYGGFAGTEATLLQRNLLQPDQKSILLGNGTDVVANDNNNLTAAALLDGFTITGGGGTSRNRGAGIMNNTSSPSFQNCNITGNTVFQGAGGGVNLTVSDSKFINCIIGNNSAFAGGGVFLGGGSVSFVNCMITNNTASDNGGGVFVLTWAEIVTFTNCQITGNKAPQGGGIEIYRVNDGNNVFFTNVTFSGNSNYAVFQTNGGPNMRNCIVFGNEFGISAGDHPELPGTVQNSLVQGRSGTLNGNISGDVNPMFVSPVDYLSAPSAAGDFRPQVCSPAINAGSNAVYDAGQTPDLTGITTDLASNVRKKGVGVDMGAYEFIGGNDGNPGAADLLAIDGDEVSVTISGSTTLTAEASDCRTVAVILPDNSATKVSGTVNAKVWVETIQPSNYVKRHYEITPVTGAATASGKITLFFTQEEFTDFNGANTIKLPIDATDAANNKANLRIEKHSGTSSDGSGLPSSYSGGISTINPLAPGVNGSIVWNNAVARWEVSFDVSGFSGFFIKTISNALPLNLLSFTVRKEVETNKLRWATANEVNTANFEVQRSPDAKNFVSIATIIAANTGNNFYTHDDPTSDRGVVYYRLKMLDLDGTFTYSRTIRVNNERNNFSKVYPNPTSLFIRIGVSPNLRNTMAKLCNLGGRLIQSISLISDEPQINVSTLTSGIYIIYFADGTISRFVKE